MIVSIKLFSSYRETLFLVLSLHLVSLEDLLESAVDWRADLVALVEVDGGNGALANALRGELESLLKVIRTASSETVMFEPTL